MKNAPFPVVLVHGWNSHPGAWNRLIARLDAAHIPWIRFDHTGMAGKPLYEIAAELGRFITAWRRDSAYDGAIDLVCHSIGTCIARYYLEVCDGSARNEKVRQIIGLGPPNNGSALAELFVHPEHGPAIIDRLTGIFVPAGYDPASDRMVQDVRPRSPFMEKLRAAGTRSDIIYRVIVTANPVGTGEFFPLFAGKTWVLAGDNEFRQTLAGDGIVAHAESVLPGVSLDVISAPLQTEENLPPPDQYCHIHLTKNPRINDRILYYLTGSVP